MENFLRAVAVLYDPGVASAQRNEANAYLVAFQQTEDAWSCMDQVLSNSQCSCNAHFLAAQVLAKKMFFDFFQLPENSLESLRDALVKHLVNHSKRGPVSTQLAKAIALLAIQAQQWTDAIPFLFSHLSALPNCFPCLLELLQMIAEEYEDRSLGVSKDRRICFRRHLDESTSSVVAFLLHCLENFGGEKSSAAKAFKCFRAWIAFCSVPANAIAQSKLLECTFQALQDESLFETAIDVLVEVCYAYRQIDTDDARVIQIVAPRVFMLKDAYLSAVSNEQDDAAVALCRVFSHMAEAYIPILLSDVDVNQAELLTLVLTCFRNKSLEVSCKTVHFFIGFLEELASTHPLEMKHRKIEQFRPYIVEVVRACTVMLQYSGGDGDDLRGDERTQYREDVGDIIVASATVLGLPAVAEAIASSLQPALEACIGSQGGDQLAAVAAEAGLFALRCLGSEFDCNRANVPSLKIILNMIPRLHDAVAKLQRSALDVVSRFARIAGANSGHANDCLGFAFQCLARREVISSASSAVKCLCTSNAPHIASRVLEDPSRSLFAAGLEAAATAEFAEDAINIYEGLAAVASSLPYAASSSVLQQLLLPSIQVLSLPDASPEYSESAVTRALDVIVTLVRHAKVNGEGNQASAAAEIVRGVWEQLQRAGNHFGQSDRVVEKLCRVFKHAIRTSTAQFKPLLGALVEMITALFCKVPKSSYMYCGSIAVSEYGSDPEAQRLFSFMFEKFCGRCFEVLGGGYEAFTESPDIAEDFFILCFRLVSKMPALIFQSTLFQPLLKLAIRGLSLEHWQANYAIMRFVATVFRLLAKAGDSVQSLPHVADFAKRAAVDVSASVLVGITGGLPEGKVLSNRQNPESLCSILEALAEYLGVDDFAACLKAAFESPAIGPHVNPSLRPKYLNDLVDASTYLHVSPRDFEDVVDEMSFASRKRQERR